MASGKYGDSVWELDDLGLKLKIADFACKPDLVKWSQTAERDIACDSEMTRIGVLEAVIDHIGNGYVINCDFMKNGDLAYILNCFVGRHRRYIKLRFAMFGDIEHMYIFSAHPNR